MKLRIRLLILFILSISLITFKLQSSYAIPAIHNTYAFKRTIHVIHLAPGYMATIVLPFVVEPNHVLVGESSLFRAKVIDNGKVITVKPITYAYHVSTDLVILGKTYKFVYKLISGKPSNANMLVFVKNPWTDTAINGMIKDKLIKYEERLREAYSSKRIKMMAEIKKLNADKQFIISEFLKLNKVNLNQEETHRGVTLKLEYVSRAGNYDYVRYKLINNSNISYTVVNVAVFNNNVPLSIYKDDLLHPLKPNTITKGFIIFKDTSKVKSGFTLAVTSTNKQKILEFKLSF